MHSFVLVLSFLPPLLKAPPPHTHIHEDKQKLEEVGVITMVTVELNTTD